MKTNTNKVLLPILAVALLFSVACDYASITAPEAIEASVTSNALPANEINSGDNSLLKRGKKKDKTNDDGSVGEGNNGTTRYGWGF